MKIFLFIFIFITNQLFAFEHLTNSDFNQKTKKGNIIVNFFAPWCSTCKKADENLVEYNKNKRDDIKIYKVDISEQIELTKRFNADSVPLFIYIKDGEIVSREHGIKTVQRIEDCINKYF